MHERERVTRNEQYLLAAVAALAMYVMENAGRAANALGRRARGVVKVLVH
jgi:hypothetical protein